MNERITAIVSGKVQGVLYRDFACREAQSLSLVGEARNLPDGTVRVIAEGDKENLLKFIARLHKGPFFSHVTKVAVTWEAVRGGYSSFTVA
jgi:acylphosphatase